MSVIANILTGSSAGKLKKLKKIVEVINNLEPSIQALGDSELRAKTDEFKKRLSDGETLDDILPEAFAVVREASVRTLGMRHFDVQLLGGMVLHQGRIAEMKTGEGKTLVATLPAYLNALSGKGVHIVTVNDYLARRDSEWMGKIHRFLGLKVGLIVHDLTSEERRKGYGADITYGTNNEYGFDYLRDNMVVYKEELVQRDLNYAIIDEVDSILIDEARTPLIISGMSEKSTDMYKSADRFVRKLRRDDDYTVDEKQKTVNLNENGIAKAESHYGVENLSDLDNTTLNHHINQVLKAHATMRRDKEYVVQNGQVIIVDEFTGRLMNGRRYSDGLHQAIEAKEGVEIEHESKTLATITFQNFFRMYSKLAGMTGTAKTEEDEFQGIYSLDVVEIPTHMEMIRKDLNDVVFTTEAGKFRAVAEEVKACHQKGQPVLVGTVSVEKSEELSSLLVAQGIRHEVLNAKFHEKEAEIVAQAGRINQVTIATNMAGRGTDILLGGNPDFMARREMKQLGYSDELIEESTSHQETDDEEILEARAKYKQLNDKQKIGCDKEHAKVVGVGGLHIVGTERHESRRIDNQLRGRSGRQGDPGSSKFFIAMEDELLRLFGGERMQGIMSRVNPDDDLPIAYGMLSKQIENAQKRLEARNYDSRKNVLKYDDVMNKQRESIYGQRRMVLQGEDVRTNIIEMAEGIIDAAAANYLADKDNRDVSGFIDHINRMFLQKNAVTYSDDLKKKSNDALIKMANEAMEQAYRYKEQEIAEVGGDMREIERVVLLTSVDRLWTDHIDNMEQLRQGIGLRAYAQRDPYIEYTVEGYEMFEAMAESIREETVNILFHIQPQERAERKRVADKVEAGYSNDGEQQVKKPHKNQGAKVGRNDPCPCGSGKKHKNCCGG